MAALQITEPGAGVQLHVDDIRELLGPPDDESHLQSQGRPFFYQGVWECGCTMEYMHDERDAYSYEPCERHGSVRHGS